MRAYKSSWYKTGFVRMLFVFLSGGLMISINFLLFTFGFWWLFLTILFWFSWWSMMRVVTRVFYEFNDEEILVHLPSKEILTLPKKDIVSVWKVNDLWGAVLRWIGSFEWKRHDGSSIFFCLTSHKHLMAIKMKNSQEYVLSPRRREEWVYDYYGRREA